MNTRLVFVPVDPPEVDAPEAPPVPFAARLAADFAAQYPTPEEDAA
jgi:hypothetical protein